MTLRTDVLKRKAHVGNRLFVGNLSFETDQSGLEAAFAAAGEVREVAIPVDRDTGRPRGFAFVTMSDAQAAAKAVTELNGTMLDGRQIRVDEAQERPRPSGGFHGGGGGGGPRKGNSRRGSRDRF